MWDEDGTPRPFTRGRGLLVIISGMGVVLLATICGMGMVLLAPLRGDGYRMSDHLVLRYFGGKLNLQSGTADVPPHKNQGYTLKLFFIFMHLFRLPYYHILPCIEKIKNWREETVGSNRI